ncbi:MAG: GIY-YIG nuclease family protein [Candidatus Aenigmarchaeota archaeon]|nr:GIY-YIG nuclease family protein [Candidatus Aenigmarchaeota archaeon]
MVPLPSNWFVYLLECRDGTYYCGITNDLSKRLKAHWAGKGAKYTKARRPFRLVGSVKVPDKVAAAKLEYSIKQLPRFEKRRFFEARGPAQTEAFIT